MEKNMKNEMEAGLTGAHRDSYSYYAPRSLV